MNEKYLDTQKREPCYRRSTPTTNRFLGVIVCKQCLDDREKIDRDYLRRIFGGQR